MSSEYDLSLAPDSRFGTFRGDYTTKQHMISIYEAIRGQAAISAAAAEMVDSRLSGISGQLDDMQWAIEDGFYVMADAIHGLRDEVRDGFINMARVTTWGVARICWEHEQDRTVYREILHVLKHPLQTQALEHRERAEMAIANKWWEDSVADLCLAVDNNKYDYLAHLQLARVLWFEYGQWEPALEHFGLAGKYADTTDADADQEYYAAVAYLHVALLWRMDAQTIPEHSETSLPKATAASRRAFELVRHGLPMAVVEHALDLLMVGRLEDAINVMEEAVSADENLLLGIETNPDLQGWDEVREWTKRWRERQPVAEVRRLADEIRSLVEAYSPQSGAETDSLRALRGDLLGGGVTTRQVLVQAIRDAREMLSAAGTQLRDAVDRSHSSVTRQGTTLAGFQADATKAASQVQRLGQVLSATAVFGEGYRRALRDEGDPSAGAWGCGLGVIWTVVMIGMLLSRLGEHPDDPGGEFVACLFMWFPVGGANIWWWTRRLLRTRTHASEIASRNRSEYATCQQHLQAANASASTAAAELRRLAQLHQQATAAHDEFANGAARLDARARQLLGEMGAA